MCVRACDEGGRPMPEQDAPSGPKPGPEPEPEREPEPGPELKPRPQPRGRARRAREAVAEADRWAGAPRHTATHPSAARRRAEGVA
ncbi:hypothetical protein GCM10018785_36790 [Streptomyces longispororuber]|uniref:Uncharacterized protein n=1 Tax=Streptomyces longispororuber TaxID=68230 RepID=A0A918ZRC0_9ACTN|nr:hypothetical protein GCM10018785_36790 [Streptomyces longispororuber]